MPWVELKSYIVGRVSVGEGLVVESSGSSNWRRWLRVSVLAAGVIFALVVLVALADIVGSERGAGTRTSYPILVGAGDISTCDNTGDGATARLLRNVVSSNRRVTVFTVGDNAYGAGTRTQFARCYAPTWGRYKARTRPAPGNHEYYTSGARGYYGYFGAAAGPRKGYYSYNRGGWHIISLNSSCEKIGGCGESSPQVRWLKADLASNPRSCTLAYFHEPLFSSGEHGNSPKVKPLWDALYAKRADVVVSAHDHDYERFAPQTPGGRLAYNRGIREFVVGTGGKELRRFGKVRANSHVRNSRTFGVLKLALRPGSYGWKFVPVAGKRFTDSGRDRCN